MTATTLLTNTEPAVGRFYVLGLDQGAYRPLDSHVAQKIQGRK